MLTGEILGRNPFYRGHSFLPLKALYHKIHPSLLCRNPFYRGHSFLHVVISLIYEMELKRSQSLLSRSFILTFYCSCTFQTFFFYKHSRNPFYRGHSFLRSVNETSLPEANFKSQSLLSRSFILTLWYRS